MYEFIEYVLSLLRRGMGLALIACIGVSAFLMAAYFVHRKRYNGTRKFPWIRALLWVILAGYLVILLYATLFFRSGAYHEWNLHLFRAWREAWNNFSVKNWANVLLNVALFGPLGFLLPLMWNKCRKWYITIPAAAVLSGMIELLQLTVFGGICDVDDLFANILGTVIGYLLLMSVLSLWNQKGKRLKAALAYGSPLLLCVGAIASIFVVYEAREFGNLPGAATYTSDTRGVEWNLDCDLPEVGKTLAVYQNQPRTLAECDSFAGEFEVLLETDFDDIAYYQEAAYYMDHGLDEKGSHFLMVSYMDQSFEYSGNYLEEEVWVSADRETVEDALDPFPVMIPERAEFSSEERGWHCFTISQYIDGAVMLDGELRCQYAQGGLICGIENDLLAYTYYREVPVISPEDAYALLRAGKFGDAGEFERHASSQLTISACRIEYEIDTKGFYQPVYAFDVASQTGDYTATLIIPAMKS